eukprot:TRINITY_DN1519_c0_g1_i4.p2 TRINITY_DN1519_c0_g1~~TRINITY_DN1519_c0_g1_i4.p2  ORF type:complete len:189 (-),score=16.54 TRINITY_DN1519_c0_g1_i4:131-697(-)
MQRGLVGSEMCIRDRPITVVKIVIGVALGLIGFSAITMLFSSEANYLSIIVSIVVIFFCLASLIQEFIPSLIESTVSQAIPIFQSHIGRGIIYILIALFGFSSMFGLLSQAAAFVILVAGIIYIIFNKKLAEKVQAEEPPISFPSNLTGANHAPGAYQPPASELTQHCLLYTSPSPRDLSTSRMPSSA